MPIDELNWMQRYVGEELVEQHQAGQLSRRELLTKLLGICGSLAGVSALLAACGDNGSVKAADPTTTAGATSSTRLAPTTAATTAAPATTAAATSTTAAPTTTSGGAAKAKLSVAVDDAGVTAGPVTFPGPASTILAYQARPSGAAQPRAGVLVIHENRGLTDHIRDVARRVAKAGYLAIAVDLASRAGGTDKAGDGIQAALTGGQPADRLADLDAAVAYLATQPDYNGKLGIMGFCFGGGITLAYAAAQPKVKAAVPYYGTPPQPVSQMANTQAAILAHYGATDSRVNGTMASLVEAMAGKTLKTVVHDGAGHAFNNDTGAAYNEGVAVAAWSLSTDWLKTQLA